MEALTALAAAVGHLAQPMSLFNVLWATLLGMAVGMLPGLTATLGIALLTTLTFRMAAEDAILILICMYVGAIYGGSRTAILLNIPGTPANAASALDGFPLARAGRAGEAMGLATAGSFFGCLIGMLLLALIAPQLAEFGLRFQSFEFFWLAVFGVVISGRLTAMDDPIKGWIAGFLGLFLAQVGQEGIHAYQRFSYGSVDLAGGFDLLPALVGAFGFAEILCVMKQPAYETVRDMSGRILPRLGQLAKRWWTITRSGVLGTLMGIIPGVGEDMGAWVSYAAARRASRSPDSFGSGNKEGLIAAETGNNAGRSRRHHSGPDAGGSGLCPGRRPLGGDVHSRGPARSADHDRISRLRLRGRGHAVLGVDRDPAARPELDQADAGSSCVSRATTSCRSFSCSVSSVSFAIASRVFDVWVMLGFGLLGFALRQMNYPMAPLVLGIVLGDILDKNFRRGMVLSDGSLEPFISRPISFVLLLLTALTILWGLAPVRQAIARLARRSN